MERNTVRHLRHSGQPVVEPGTVWRDDSGWHYACPLGCAVPRGQAFAGPGDATHAFVAHWREAKEEELAAISRSFYRDTT